MDLRVLTVTKNTYFSLLTHTKKLLLVAISDSTAGIGDSEVGRDADAVWTDRREG